MRWDRMTVMSQEAFQAAQAKAEEMGHQEVRPEHLLWSFLNQEANVVGAVLNKLGVGLQKIRQELETGSVIVDLVTSEMPDAEIPRAVILRDSFGMSLVPFLAEHFGHATYLWTTDPTLKQIERERPSVVIWEITERFLMHPVPKPWADAG